MATNRFETLVKDESGQLVAQFRMAGENLARYSDDCRPDPVYTRTPEQINADIVRLEAKGAAQQGNVAELKRAGRALGAKLYN
jgi:hypothetical protein